MYRPNILGLKNLNLLTYIKTYLYKYDFKQTNKLDQISLITKVEFKF